MYSIQYDPMDNTYSLVDVEIVDGIIEDAPKQEVLRPDCDLPPVSVADGYRAFDLIGPLVESMSFGK